MEVVWTQFPLHPETPQEGRSYQDLFSGREAQVEAMKERIRAIAQEEGLPYGDRDYTFNSRLAQELAKWADGREGGARLYDALFRKVMVEAKNIAEADVLLEAVAEAGLPADGAREVIEQRTYSDAVDQDWRRSAEIGVTGVPTFVAGGYGVVGAQPYEVLQQLVERAGARKREGGTEPAR